MQSFRSLKPRLEIRNQAPILRATHDSHRGGGGKRIPHRDLCGRAAPGVIDMAVTGKREGAQVAAGLGLVVAALFRAREPSPLPFAPPQCLANRAKSGWLRHIVSNADQSIPYQRI